MLGSEIKMSLIRIFMVLQQTSPLFYYTESPLSYDMQYDMQLREQQPPRFVLQSKYISALVAMNRIPVLYIGREVEIARYQE